MSIAACDFNYKILLLGDSSVGKTCFLLRYIEDTYTGNHISTIGVDYKIKLIQLNSEMIKLQIWDTAGQDKFRSITKNYYRGSDGIMLIYDITNQSSFVNIKNWIIQIKEHLGDEACITLIGNKIDLESRRKISREEGQKFAKDYNLNFFETSSKEDINIKETFENLTIEMRKKVKNNSDDKRKSKSLIEKNKETKKKCCN